jgi:hypothetical protein
MWVILAVLCHGHLKQNRLTTQPELPASQSWRFVPIEVGIVSAKEEVLQALRVPQNVAWNPLTLRTKEIDKSVDRGGNTLMNQRIRLHHFCVAFCCQPKSSKLLEGVLPLF